LFHLHDFELTTDRLQHQLPCNAMYQPTAPPLLIFSPSSLPLHRFSLIVWEPKGTADSYRISHLSFQEYFCASIIAREPSAAGSSDSAAWGAFTGMFGRFSDLLGSSKYQVVTQMCLELLMPQPERAALLSRELLRPNEEGEVKVDGGGDVRTMAGSVSISTLLALVGAVGAEEGAGMQVKLGLGNCGLDDDAMAAAGRIVARGGMRALVGLDMSESSMTGTRHLYYPPSYIG
jgi:hypothetical protein